MCQISAVFDSHFIDVEMEAMRGQEACLRTQAV